jgi:putative glycerol-1-phosphate prenyltransferase
MRDNGILESIRRRAAAGEKALCLLIDPDKAEDDALIERLRLAESCGIGYLLVGGSLLTGGEMSRCLRRIKELTDLPVVLFPGSTMQLSEEADALLFLSLISGRNADLLIGRHVEAAPYLMQSRLEVIATGYMLIDGGRPTTASYISGTMPIPRDKPEIAASTAMAAELLGMKLLYLDAGSGAQHPVPARLIEAVKKRTSLPVIVGGGMRTAESLREALEAGADMVVLGNVIEEAPSSLPLLAAAVRSLS